MLLLESQKDNFQDSGQFIRSEADHIKHYRFLNMLWGCCHPCFLKLIPAKSISTRRAASLYYSDHPQLPKNKDDNIHVVHHQMRLSYFQMDI